MRKDYKIYLYLLSQVSQVPEIYQEKIELYEENIKLTENTIEKLQKIAKKLENWV